MQNEYEKLTLVVLKQTAKEQGINVPPAIKKADLIKLLTVSEKKAEEDTLVKEAKKTSRQAADAKKTKKSIKKATPPEDDKETREESVQTKDLKANTDKKVVLKDVKKTAERAVTKETASEQKPKKTDNKAQEKTRTKTTGKNTVVNEETDVKEAEASKSPTAVEPIQNEKIDKPIAETDKKMEPLTHEAVKKRTNLRQKQKNHLKKDKIKETITDQTIESITEKLSVNDEKTIPKIKSEVAEKTISEIKPEITEKTIPKIKPKVTKKPALEIKSEVAVKPAAAKAAFMERPAAEIKSEIAEKPAVAEESALMEKPVLEEKPVVVKSAVIIKESVTEVPERRQENSFSDRRQQPSQRSNRQQELEHLDSGMIKEGILEIMPDGYGFIRCDNYLPGENDVYVAPTQIRRLNLKTGDMICGNVKVRSQNEKFSALLYVRSVNGYPTQEANRRKRFEDLTPIFPNERIHLETPGCGISMRMVDLICPIGKGQRGMIVSQPKAGKTTLLKQVAKAIKANHPDIHLIILLIDERPEEVTDMKESIEGENVEVIYSTFDELPDNHKRVSEMVIERAKRLVEHQKDVVILLDSITRLARAYNLTVTASGRTLSGGLDPAALYMPKRFFGAARNMREGGSLTILATALVETGSRMDDVVFEEFKGTGNMELVLDRNLSEKRIFPAIDLPKSSTRRDDLLLSQQEMEANFLMRRALNSIRSDDAVERIIGMFSQTKTNVEFIDMVRRTRIV